MQIQVLNRFSAEQASMMCHSWQVKPNVDWTFADTGKSICTTCACHLKSVLLAKKVRRRN